MTISIQINYLLDSGMKQIELAKALGCSQSTVSEIKNEKLGVVRPSYALVKSINKLYASKVKSAARAAKRSAATTT